MMSGALFSGLAFSVLAILMMVPHFLFWHFRRPYLLRDKGEYRTSVSGR